MALCTPPQPITVTLIIQYGDNEPETRTFNADTVDINYSENSKQGDYLSEDTKTTVVTLEQRTIRKA